MILVTGAAGYIGSHTIRRLAEKNYPCIALDNLTTGHRWAVPDGIPFFEGNAGDKELVAGLIDKHAVSSIIHFAASVKVEESTVDPLRYYENNFVQTLNLIRLASQMGVDGFVFSSTAAVYGASTDLPVREDSLTVPINPYGQSKLMVEHVLNDLMASKQSTMRHVIMRYFNVAGASVDGALGPVYQEATHLVKVAAETACGKRDKLIIFGTDYETPDGTCVRDYIHVEDLAEAHIRAIEYLRQGGRSEVVNCGYGRGYSVNEVIKVMKQVSGQAFKTELGPRRRGDSPAIFADNRKIRNLFGWEPQYDSLEMICKTAYQWERVLLEKRLPASSIMSLRGGAEAIPSKR